MHDRLMRGFRFLASGCASALVVFAALYLLHTVAGLWYLAASATGFALAVALNFALQKRWVFGSTTGNAAHEARAFLAVNAGTFLLNIALMYAAVDGAGLPALWAQFVSAGVIACISYVLYRAIFTAIPKETARADGAG